MKSVLKKEPPPEPSEPLNVARSEAPPPVEPEPMPLGLGVSSSPDVPRVALRSSGGVALGLLPDPTALLRAGVGVQAQDWSVRAEWRAVIDVTHRFGASAAVTGWMGGDLAGCGHALALLAACGHVLIGRVHGRGLDLDVEREADGITASIGASLHLEWPAFSWLTLELQAELDVPVVVPQVLIDHDSVWVASPVAGHVTGGFAVLVP